MYHAICPLLLLYFEGLRAGGEQALKIVWLVKAGHAACFMSLLMSFPSSFLSIFPWAS